MTTSTVIAGWWRWRVVASVAGWPWRRRHCRAPIETTELSLEASVTHGVDDGGGSAGSGGRSIWPAHDPITGSCVEQADRLEIAAMETDDGMRQ